RSEPRRIAAVALRGCRGATAPQGDGLHDSASANHALNKFCKKNVDGRDKPGHDAVCCCGKEKPYAAFACGGASACQLSARCNFGSVIVCRSSSVMPGIISSTTRPFGVTSITARSV